MHSSNNCIFFFRMHLPVAPPVFTHVTSTVPLLLRSLSLSVFFFRSQNVVSILLTLSGQNFANSFGIRILLPLRPHSRPPPFFSPRSSHSSPEIARFFFFSSFFPVPFSANSPSLPIRRLLNECPRPRLGPAKISASRRPHPPALLPACSAWILLFRSSNLGA